MRSATGRPIVALDARTVRFAVTFADRRAIDLASSLSGPSGQAVTISGNALFGARFQNASTQNPNGTASFTGSTDMKPTTPLIKEVKLVEDFERVLLWGTGLDHLACPKVSELAGPFRVVLDFPTPP